MIDFIDNEDDPELLRAQLDAMSFFTTISIAGKAINIAPGLAVIVFGKVAATLVEHNMITTDEARQAFETGLNITKQQKNKRLQ